MWKRFFASVLLASVVLAVLVARVDINRVTLLLRDARWSALALALATNFFVIWLKSQRWATAITGGESERPRRRLFAAGVIGTAGNAVLPARLGDFLRALVLRKHNGIASGRALLAGWAVQSLDLAVVALLLLVGIAFGKGLATGWLLWLVLGGVVAGVVATGVGTRDPDRLVALARYLPARFQAAVGGQLNQALAGLRFIRHPTTLLLILCQTTLIWGCEVAAVWIALAAFGVEVNFAAAGLLVAATGLSFVLPLTPGNVGTYQLIAVSVLGSFGIAYDPAFAFALCYQASSLMAVLLAGTWFFQREGLSLRRLEDVS